MLSIIFFCVLQIVVCCRHPGLAWKEKQVLTNCDIGIIMKKTAGTRSAFVDTNALIKPS